MDRSNIRVKSYAVFLHDGKILVNPVFEDGRIKGYRVPGGHVEFFEQSIDTLVREIKEELNTDICNLRALPPIENLFHFEGKPGHEVTFCYLADFVDRSFYERPSITANELGQTFTLTWLDPFNLPDNALLFPKGLDQHLRAVQSKKTA